jgi:hypothetical protein
MRIAPTNRAAVPFTARLRVRGTCPINKAKRPGTKSAASKMKYPIGQTINAHDLQELFFAARYILWKSGAFLPEMTDMTLRKSWKKQNPGAIMIA